MKVLLITTSYPDYKGSQRGIFIRKLCLELLKNSIEVLVITPKILAQSAYFENDAGIEVYRFWFPSNNKQLNQTESIKIIPMSIYMISGLLKALLLIKRHKPDIIHGNWIVPTGLIAAVAGQITRIPILNTAHGMDIRISERQPIRSLFNLAVKLSNKTIIVSPSMKSRRLLKNAQVLPMGVDDVFFQLHPDRTTNTVIYTRSLESVYNVETLIRSIPLIVKTIPDARFIIAGTGSQEAYIKDLAKETGVDQHIEFLGHVPCENIPCLLEKASVYVSTAVADGTSPALLEAIAAGLTPVVSDIEANRSLITNVLDGYFFTPKDPKDLSEKIIQALSGSIPKDTLDSKSSKMKDSISWSSITNKFISIYNQLALANKK